MFDLIIKTDTIQLSSGRDGYWLYDYKRGMNLAMRAKTEHEAFIKALEYYQIRLERELNKNKQLENKINAFVSQFIDDDYEIDLYKGE